MLTAASDVVARICKEIGSFIVYVLVDVDSGYGYGALATCVACVISGPYDAALFGVVVLLVVRLGCISICVCTRICCCIA